MVQFIMTTIGIFTVIYVSMWASKKDLEWQYYKDNRCPICGKEG